MFMSAKSEENLAKAEKMYAQATNAAEKMNGISDTLDNIYSLASDYNEFLMAFSSKFKEVITGVNRIYIDQYTLCSKNIWNRGRGNEKDTEGVVYQVPRVYRRNIYLGSR